MSVGIRALGSFPPKPFQNQPLDQPQLIATFPTVMIVGVWPWGLDPPCGSAHLSPSAHSDQSTPVQPQCLGPLAFGSVHCLYALPAHAVRVCCMCVACVRCLRALPACAACASCVLPVRFVCALYLRTLPARCLHAVSVCCTLCLHNLPMRCACCLLRHVHPTGLRLSYCQPSASLQVPMGARPTHVTMSHSTMFRRG